MRLILIFRRSGKIYLTMMGNDVFFLSEGTSSDIGTHRDCCECFAEVIGRRSQRAVDKQ